MNKRNRGDGTEPSLLFCRFYVGQSCFESVFFAAEHTAAAVFLPVPNVSVQSSAFRMGWRRTVFLFSGGTFRASER